MEYSDSFRVMLLSPPTLFNALHSLFMPGHSKTSPRTKFHSATPVFSPAQRPAGSSSRASASFDPSKTPTTAELYRYMSLAINDDEDE